MRIEDSENFFKEAKARNIRTLRDLENDILNPGEPPIGRRSGKQAWLAKCQRAIRRRRNSESRYF